MYIHNGEESVQVQEYSAGQSGVNMCRPFARAPQTRTVEEAWPSITKCDLSG